ncbi:hypothetical protein ACFVT1_21775 [Streptomyces sp. NPDC057963]|uniref:hypothetical protein n=1 Tax=Streptomyces sp. NPDC057963 TaxID=3346290 RepID=UPI0036E43EB5
MKHSMSTNPQHVLSENLDNEAELDLVIGELEQEIPARASSETSTCVRVYCSL